MIDNKDTSEKERQEKEQERLLTKFRQQINARGGIFTRKKTREQILGIRGRSGRYRTKHAFWQEQKEKVRSALVDLEMFLETAESKYVSEVLNLDSLRPVVVALLWHHDQPDLKRAEIAHLFIKAGFDYLTGMTVQKIPTLVTRVVSEAIELSHLLVESFKPESE